MDQHLVFTMINCNMQIDIWTTSIFLQYKSVQSSYDDTSRPLNCSHRNPGYEDSFGRSIDISSHCYSYYRVKIRCTGGPQQNALQT